MRGFWPMSTRTPICFGENRRRVLARGPASVKTQDTGAPKGRPLTHGALWTDFV